MATKTFYFPCTVVEKQEIKELDGGKSVLNMIVSRTHEAVEGFKEEMEKRIVMFSRKAQEADRKLKNGDTVVFSGCKRNPRAFTTDSGNLIETVDILAEQFTVIPKSGFAKIAASLEEQGKVIGMDELSYTDEDAAKEAAKASMVTDKEPAI